jgi:hypothetical protein
MTQTVSCSNATLWGIPNQSFRRILKQISEKQFAENIQLLNRVPLFEILSQQQKNMICDGVQVTIFQKGGNVCKRGELGDSLMIVKSGALKSSRGKTYKSGGAWFTGSSRYGEQLVPYCLWPFTASKPPFGKNLLQPQP